MKKIKEINKEIGEELIEKIFTKEELFKNSWIEGMPDLIIKPQKGVSFFYKLKKRELMEDIISNFDEYFKGIHDDKGIYLIKGNEVNTQIKLELNLVDIPSYIICFLGLPLPEYFEGKVSSCIVHKTPQYFKYNFKFRNKREYSYIDEERVKERLKGLGYL